MSPRRKINSLNQLNSSPQNVERLFHEACFKVKEGFVLKKWGFELPEHLHPSHLPPESLAFDKDILLLITKKMGIQLSNR